MEYVDSGNTHMVLEKTVGQALREKNRKEVLCISPNEMVFNALRIMAIHNVGALLVRENTTIIGIITERDYARKVVLADRSSRTTRVREIMESSVLYVSPQDPIEGCLALMSENRIRHLAVIDNSMLVGLISMGDVVKAVISDQEFMIDQLTRYIHGSYSGYFDHFGPGRATVIERVITQDL